MLRKLLLPIAAAALLGGCATDGYNYRSGPGDYYYGTPSVDYRHYGSPYGYYGSPGFYRGGYGYYGGYGGFYRNPYYPWYPRHYYNPQPRPDDGAGRPAPEHGGNDNDRPAPWRNLDELRRRDESRIEPGPSVRRIAPRTVHRPRVAPRPTVTPRPSRGGSRMDRMEGLIERSRGRQGEDRPIP